MAKLVVVGALAVVLLSWVPMIEDDGLMAPYHGPTKVPPGFYDPLGFHNSYTLRLFLRRALYCRLLGVPKQQSRRCIVYG